MKFEEKKSAQADLILGRKIERCSARKKWKFIYEACCNRFKPKYWPNGPWGQNLFNQPRGQGSNYKPHYIPHKALGG